MSYQIVCGYPGEFNVEIDDKLRQIVHDTAGQDIHMFPEDDRFDDEVLNIIPLAEEAIATALKLALKQAGIAGLNVRIEDTQQEMES